VAATRFTPWSRRSVLAAGTSVFALPAYAFAQIAS
jgi:hypothetical protein